MCHFETIKNKKNKKIGLRMTQLGASPLNVFFVLCTTFEVTSCLWFPLRAFYTCDQGSWEKLTQDFLWSWLVVRRPWSQEFTLLIESLHHKTWLKANLRHDVVFWMRTKKQIKIKMAMFAQIGFTKYIHVILLLMTWSTYFLLRHPI